MRWPLRVMRAEHLALWDRGVLIAFGVGFDRGRVIFPIRDRWGVLQGVLRYAPTHERAPKMLAVAGTRLGLLPHPAAELSEEVVLVEGPPDMLAARSNGWPAIAVPGDDAWAPEFAEQLAGRRVVIVMDADDAGRRAAVRIAGDLAPVAGSVAIAELHPGRDDGADLTDWLARNHERGVEQLRAMLAQATVTVDERGVDEERLERLGRERAASDALGRFEPLLGRIVTGSLAGALAGAREYAADAGDQELRALATVAECVWARLDQPAARKASGLERELRAHTESLVALQLSLVAADQPAVERESRDREPAAKPLEQVAAMRERIAAIRGECQRVGRELDELHGSAAEPLTWAREHAAEFVRGLAAREERQRRHQRASTTPSRVVDVERRAAALGPTDACEEHRQAGGDPSGADGARSAARSAEAQMHGSAESSHRSLGMPGSAMARLPAPGGARGPRLGR